MNGGVIRTDIEYRNLRDVVDTKTIQCSDEVKEFVKNWLLKQVGKKYDFWGIFAFLFVFSRPKKGYWYCSELAMVALAKLKGKSDEIESNSVSPQMFWDILTIVE